MCTERERGGGCTSAPRAVLCCACCPRNPRRPAGRLTPLPSPLPALPCCSFLLQLGLLDFACSAYPASLLAASALSLAAAAFSNPEWPQVYRCCGYLPDDLAACKERLAAVQAAQVRTSEGRPGRDSDCCCSAARGGRRQPLPLANVRRRASMTALPINAAAPCCSPRLPAVRRAAAAAVAAAARAALLPRVQAGVGPPPGVRGRALPPGAAVARLLHAHAGVRGLAAVLRHRGGCHAAGLTHAPGVSARRWRQAVPWARGPWPRAGSPVGCPAPPVSPTPPPVLAARCCWHSALPSDFIFPRYNAWQAARAARKYCALLGPGGPRALCASSWTNPLVEQMRRKSAPAPPRAARQARRAQAAGRAVFWPCVFSFPQVVLTLLAFLLLVSPCVFFKPQSCFSSVFFPVWPPSPGPL